MIFSKIRYTKQKKDEWKGSNTMWEEVSFASKWKTRNRKGIWVYNTYSDINKINEKAWNNLKKNTSPTQMNYFHRQEGDSWGIGCVFCFWMKHDVSFVSLRFHPTELRKSSGQKEMIDFEFSFFRKGSRVRLALNILPSPYGYKVFRRGLINFMS